MPGGKVADDGKEAVAALVAQAEAAYVVVEGWVGQVGPATGTNVTLRGARVPFGLEAYPWLSFPIARQAESVRVASALRDEFARQGSNIRVMDARAYEILDASAVERMAERSEAGQVASWARSLTGQFGGVAVHMESPVARAFLDLRDATDAKAADGDLVLLMRSFAEAVSRSREPQETKPGVWKALRIATLGLTCRLDAMPAPAPAMGA